MKNPDCGFGIGRFVNLTSRLSVLVLAVVAVACPPGARAVAFRLPNQDPEAIARGNAFAATADNPSAIYYNPAGITQLGGNDLSLGVYSVSAGIDYTSPSGQTDHAKSYFQEVPQIYYTCAPTNWIVAFGLGIYSPYGLGLDWNDNAPFNTVAERGKVIYACVNPVIAVKILPSLSFAAGPTYNYSQAELQRAFYGGQFEYKGTGSDWGFNAGLRWQPIQQLAFGVNYRYQTDINYDGYLRTTSPFVPIPPPSSDVHASVKYPQFVVGGISYRPTKNWNIEFDLDWTDWNSDKQIVFQDANLMNPAFVLNYRDSLMYEFGVTRQLPKSYFVNVGYFYSENSSANNADFNPLVPDSDLQLGSVGFGHHGKHWDWAAAYQFGYNGGRTVSGSTPVVELAPQSADGTYKTFNQAFNISVGYKF
jgi:long-chain fatty acid transport protein